jgi:hypothetical protein
MNLDERDPLEDDELVEGEEIIPPVDDDLEELDEDVADVVDGIGEEKWDVPGEELEPDALDEDE